MLVDRSVISYATHIEVKPYVKGDAPEIEASLSKWYPNKFRWKPIGYYIDGDTLYIPKGYNFSKIVSAFEKNVTINNICSSVESMRTREVIPEMKNDTTDKNILNSLNSISYAGKSGYTQTLLILDDDKRMEVVTRYIVNKAVKTMIITNHNKNRNIWKSYIHKKTNIPLNKIEVIGCNTNFNRINREAYVYIVNNRTLELYGERQGWIKLRDFMDKLHLGIRVVDEASERLKTMIMLDMFSNVCENIYVTNHITKSDSKEYYIFKTVMNAAYTINAISKKEPITKYLPLLFNSNPSEIDIHEVQNNHWGISLTRYYEYEMDTHLNLINNLIRCVRTSIERSGKMVILVNRIADMARIKSIILDDLDLPDDSEYVYTVTSKTKEITLRESEDDCKIYIMTQKTFLSKFCLSVGSLITIAPIEATVVFEKIVNKLDSNSIADGAIFIDLIDIGFSKFVDSFNSKSNLADSICKEINLLQV